MKPLTDNQTILLLALSVAGAKLGGTRSAGWYHSYEIHQPGVPARTQASKNTVRACLRRGLIAGNQDDGYTITMRGRMALIGLPL